ncbi:MAG TPA: S-adenosylmethionine:tRNA ribosyltransferase-isomerase [Acidimicrobiales bacterium]|jgi:S-adenosylmethionine:tRNA ribosyltransferase-isomerase|nr:S-adenosylmethionine:tRNA ribosyltransferase-isomerase [Acidimicrobiales bacterium]
MTAPTPTPTATAASTALPATSAEPGTESSRAAAAAGRPQGWSDVDFTLDPARIAPAPVEARGGRRDATPMMVSHRDTGTIVHATVSDLPDLLDEGDALVVNRSATLPAAVRTTDGRIVHLSTELPGGLWTVEVRRACGAGSRPWFDGRGGETIDLVGGGKVELLSTYPVDTPAPHRLWVAHLDLGAPLTEYLGRNGRPIRYGCIDDAWPIRAYQTVFGEVPGSAEMPSASRPFTAELVARLRARGVRFAPITLHTGVSSLEAHEPPYAERYEVPAATAEVVNDAHWEGRRVVAVGTTATRALETTADDRGVVHPGGGWTELVITPERGVRAIDGIISGWHEPEASHLALMEAVTGRDLLQRSYDAALAGPYLWHEFGDLHLVLP